jgi:hypothetical protein
VGRIAGAAWAGFYDRVGTSFAVSVAPRIRAFYATTPRWHLKPEPARRMLWHRAAGAALPR